MAQRVNGRPPAPDWRDTRAMPAISLHRLASPAVVPPLLGLLFGVIVSLLNGSSFPPLVAASLVLGAGWSWAALAVAMGALAAGLARASLRGAVSLVMAVAGYYAMDLLRGVYRGVDQADPHMSTFTDWHGALTDLAYWSAIALIAGPLLGLAGWRARRPGPAGLICRLLVPAAAAAEMIWRLRGEARFQPHAAIADVTWTATVIIAIAAGALLATRHRRAGSPDGQGGRGARGGSGAAGSRW